MTQVMEKSKAAKAKDQDIHTALVGMKAICDYIGRSEATVLKLIQSEGLPATKIAGIWESDRELIGDWRKKKIMNRGNR